ncbi:MAG: hypothetical protein II179_00180 [Alphaproteobacteria bacterium]|nr:hypothetical protein [Alphaproteobacteria bacterium]
MDKRTDAKKDVKNLKIKGYKKGTLLVPKNSAEAELQKVRRHRRLGALLAVTGVLGMWAPIIADELGVDEKRLELIENMWAIDVVSLLVSSIGVAAIMGGSVDYERVEKQLKDLLTGAMENDVFVTELAKMGPVFQRMLKDLLNRKPALAGWVLQADFSKMNEQFIYGYTHDYLKAHPDDAQKFLSLLTIAGVPKNIIDRFIMTYIPGTISFNMAQEMLQKR